MQNQVSEMYQSFKAIDLVPSANDSLEGCRGNGTAFHVVETAWLLAHLDLRMENTRSNVVENRNFRL